ncbi:MAG: class I SAM-dependent methyltransferase [Chloroflexota bacterium]
MATGKNDPKGALLTTGLPWEDEQLAQLYDAFPFDEDIPLYLELAQEAGGPLLELGCGSGRVLVPLAEAGHEVVGVDISAPMLDLARRKLEASTKGAAARARLVHHDMRTLDLHSPFALAIVPVKTFAYFTSRRDQQQVLAAIAAHLRPAGLLVLDLMNPSPAWLSEPPGSLRQDLVHYVPASGVTVARTEAVVWTDLAAQVRRIRSAYEVIEEDGATTKRMIEWSYRYVYRFEAEHLLERAGFEVKALYGGYQRQTFVSESRHMIFLARRPAG